MQPGEYKIDKVKFTISSDEVRMDLNNRNRGKLKLPYGTRDLESRTLDLLVQMLQDYRLRGPEVDLLGEWLYRVLLEKTFGEDLHAQMADKSTFLRIELAFDDPNGPFAKLPWEYLRRPPAPNDRQGWSEPYFLSTHEQIALLRLPHVACGQLRVAEKPRILIVACSPRDLPQLLFEELTKKITDKIKSLDAAVRVLATPYAENPEIDGPGDEVFRGLESFAGPATFDNFVRELELQPHVVHFLGHGKNEKGQGKIAFSQDNLRADWKTGDDIAKRLPHSLKLAFLQACESAKESGTKKYRPSWSDAYQALSSVAGRVVQVATIPAIVAMQAKVKNISANDFAYAFYDALVQGQPVYRAVQLARAASKGPAECVPVLYLDTGGENDEGVLFPAPGLDNQPERAQGGAAKRPSNIRCPWCGKYIAVTEGTAVEDMRFCSNPKCRSPLRCPNCPTRVGEVGVDEQETACVRCATVMRRGTQVLSIAEERQSGFVAAPLAGAAAGASQEQPRIIRQSDVFDAPQRRAATSSGDSANGV